MSFSRLIDFSQLRPSQAYKLVRRQYQDLTKKYEITPEQYQRLEDSFRNQTEELLAYMRMRKFIKPQKDYSKIDLENIYINNQQNDKHAGLLKIMNIVSGQLENKAQSIKNSKQLQTAVDSVRSILKLTKPSPDDLAHLN